MALAVDKAQELTSRGRAAFDADEMLRFAAEAIISRLGEAANRVPVAVQAAHPEIPWRRIVGARNRTVHEYHRVDYEIVWEAISVQARALADPIAALRPSVDQDDQRRRRRG